MANQNPRIPNPTLTVFKLELQKSFKKRRESERNPPQSPTESQTDFAVFSTLFLRRCLPDTRVITPEPTGVCERRSRRTGTTRPTECTLQAFCAASLRWVRFDIDPDVAHERSGVNPALLFRDATHSTHHAFSVHATRR